MTMGTHGSADPRLWSSSDPTVGHLAMGLVVTQRGSAVTHVGSQREPCVGIFSTFFLI
jgi:hypothetical protein